MTSHGEELLAGQAWAFSMVNMRQPEVLLHLFVTPHAANHPLPTAFQRGIAAALVMRQETTSRHRDDHQAPGV